MVDRREGEIARGAVEQSDARALDDNQRQEDVEAAGVLLSAKWRGKEV